MSIRIISAIFESETLGPTERLIMLALADHADDRGRCFPSIARLCKRTGLTSRTVQSNIRKLQGAGYLSIQTGVGPGGVNVYFITATPAGVAPPMQEMHPILHAPSCNTFTPPLQETRLPVPLRNRCTVIELPALNMKELANFTQREVARRGLSEQSAEAIVATLSHPISRHGYFSLRDVVRMIDRAEVLEKKPRLH